MTIFKELWKQQKNEIDWNQPITTCRLDPLNPLSEHCLFPKKCAGMIDGSENNLTNDQAEIAVLKDTALSKKTYSLD